MEKNVAAHNLTVVNVVQPRPFRVGRLIAFIILCLLWLPLGVLYGLYCLLT